MTDRTKIEWTDYTVNFWEGCQKVGPGCDNCYAEARDVRFTGGKHWGPGAPRRKVKNGIPNMRKINRHAKAFRAETGHWPRVFCSSLSDVFDNAVPSWWREDAFVEIEDARNCRIQLLTKRVGNVGNMIPGGWYAGGWPDHVGLMITVVNQDEADRDIPKLLRLKGDLGIPWVGISYEPALGPVDFRGWIPGDNGCELCDDGEGFVSSRCQRRDIPRNEQCPDNWSVFWQQREGYGDERVHLDWIICGGESGPGARDWPGFTDAARSVRDQCKAAGTAFFMKQMPKLATIPEDLMVRQFPEALS